MIYVVLLVLSLGLAVGISLFGLQFGFIFLGVVIGLPLVIYSIANPKFGIIVLLCISYCLGIAKFVPGVPFGVGLDIFLGALLIAMIFDKWRKNDFTVAGNSISYVVWLWIIYNCFEFVNPMASREAWGIRDPWYRIVDDVLLHHVAFNGYIKVHQDNHQSLDLPDAGSCTVRTVPGISWHDRSGACVDCGRRFSLQPYLQLGSLSHLLHLHRPNTVWYFDVVHRVVLHCIDTRPIQAVV